jgi:hypothetical protein
MLRIKQFIVGVGYYFLIVVDNLLFKKEIEAKTAELTKNLMKIEEKKAEIRDFNKTQYENSKNSIEKEKLLRFTRLQASLFRAYRDFTTQIQTLNGVEMEEVRDLWLETVKGLNTTITVPFRLPDDISIKTYFYEMDREMDLILSSDAEWLKQKEEYKGPTGNS